MSARIIQFGRHGIGAGGSKGGWEAWEAEGVSPVYCGPNAREQALSYARQRAGYGRAEIQVMNESGEIAETMSNEDARPLV
jgi:hypothetical protein